MKRKSRSMSDVLSQIGHYRLGKTLGIGSLGKVKCTWRTLV